MKLTKKQIIYSPSDLSAHGNCKHLTQLDKKLAKKEIPKPFVFENRVLKVLIDKGNEFEKQYLEEIKNQGKIVAEIDSDDPKAEEYTISSMQNGVDVIYQARLKEQGKWSGWADFLIKVSKPSKLGNWSYEVWDTKLANETKAGTILQIGLYSERVAKIQGITPEYMGVIKPDGKERFRYDEHAAYIRLVKHNLEEVIDKDQVTYPDPVNHCDICKWWKNCNLIRRRDDHLTFVAGLGASQMKELKAQGIHTLKQLANLDLPIPFNPSKGAKETYTKLREQARVQYESRIKGGIPIYETLEIEEGRGLNKLPAPSDNDIYLDFEGDRMVEPDGLEYMIGYVHRGQYHALWATNEREERAIFEQFIDFAFELKQQDPSLHIYHYAPYEVSAFKRLMGKYASRENEIDSFLRSQTFVDLYSIVRQSVRASVEKYSIKDLEVFFGYERKMDLRKLSNHKSQLELLLQTGNINELEAITKDAVQLYNQDDCESLIRLQSWLEKIRAELIQKGEHITRPEPTDGEASDKITEHQERIKPIIDALMQNVSQLEEERNKEDQAKYILANMLDWYRREQKTFWWEFFRLKELPEDELMEERKAISYLKIVGKREPIKRSILDTYTFPEQECDLRAGAKLETKEGNGTKTIGTIHSIDYNARILKVKKGQKLANERHPDSVFSMDNISPEKKENAIINFASWVVSNGVDSELEPYKAARDLLLNKLPKTHEAVIQHDDFLKRAYDFSEKLNKSYLPIQGPPGSGKSFIGSHMIVQLVKQGKKIGVTALSHKVITNLLQKAWEVAQKQNIELSIIQKTNPDDDNPLPWQVTNAKNTILSKIGKADIIAGTSFMWSDLSFKNSVDYLFVDEAGQLALIDTLAIAHTFTNLVLLGDPQQLKQPQQGVHPKGTEVSALEHVLQGKKTISTAEGIFLEKTWRMHSSINSFVSELYYENRLQSKTHLEQQALIGSQYAGSGLYLEAVHHSGNSSSSSEEVEAIVQIVNTLTAGNVFFVNEEGQQAVLTANDVKIISPYNSQVFALKQALPTIEIGTVDKFQGQEAPVIIYSVATSSVAEAPRGMDFLFSPNRLNVAVSRARTRFIMVANPDIFQSDCKSPHQIRLANAFCRFRELLS